MSCKLSRRSGTQVHNGDLCKNCRPVPPLHNAAPPWQAASQLACPQTKSKDKATADLSRWPQDHLLVRARGPQARGNELKPPTFSSAQRGGGGQTLPPALPSSPAGETKTTFPGSALSGAAPRGLNAAGPAAAAAGGMALWHAASAVRAASTSTMGLAAGPRSSPPVQRVQGTRGSAAGPSCRRAFAAYSVRRVPKRWRWRSSTRWRWCAAFVCGRLMPFLKLANYTIAPHPPCASSIMCLIHPSCGQESSNHGPFNSWDRQVHWTDADQDCDGAALVHQTVRHDCRLLLRHSFTE